MKSNLGSKRSFNLKPFFGSIRFRLLLWGEAVLLLVLIVFSAMVYYRQVDLQKAALMRSIETQAGFILDRYREYLRNGGQDGLSLGSVFPELQLDSHQKPVIVGKVANSALPLNQNGEFLLVIGPDNQVVDWIGDLSKRDVADLGQVDSRKEIQGFLYTMVTLHDPETDQPTLEYLVLHANSPLPVTNRMRIILGAPFDPNRQLPELALTLVVTSLIVLSISLVGGYWLTGRLMQPLQAITRMAQEINTNDLTRRLNLGKQDELGELANTFDRMLDRLQGAFERQRQFTADASHELRTPLTIISLEANHHLEDTHPLPEVQKSFAVIRDESERMTHLVNNLLVLARADTGNARLNPEVVDLSELALDVVERLIPLSQRHAVTITTGEMPPVKVQGDRFYLSQMITNLVENAIKHGAGEEKEIWIETGCIQDGGSDAPGGPGRGWLRVKDHGPGISPEHLPHLFDRFYQADPARTTVLEALDARNGEISASSDGHGLGLSIVQWVARAHGGDVEVTSQVGKGAVFTVFLPVAEGDSGGSDPR